MSCVVAKDHPLAEEKKYNRKAAFKSQRITTIAKYAYARHY